MYKVILVDDDELVRVGLEAIVSFRSKGFEIVDTLSSGEQALKSIRKHQPDVIITDLYMPEISGIQLIRECKKICPKAIIVVLSCHNDIDSVKEAMQLGAFDYLLKSSLVDPKNAERLLDRIRVACSQRGQSDGGSAPTQRSQKQAISSYLKNGKPAAVLAQQVLSSHGFDCAGPNLFLAGLQLDTYDTIRKMVSNEAEMTDKVEQLVENTLSGLCSCFCVHDADGLFLLLMQVHSASAAISPYSRLISLCERLRLSIKNQLLHTCSIYTDRERSFGSLPDAYRALLQEIEVTRSIRFDSVVDLVAYSDSICEQVREDEPEELPAHPIEVVISYIEANYAAQLTLDELAGVANFSKYHLCRKFKEVTHTSVVDYILRCRIERAKELLRSPNGRHIFNIAQEVGFNDTSYFNRIFKKYSGYTPNEYQKLQKKNSPPDAPAG